MAEIGSAVLIVSNGIIAFVWGFLTRRHHVMTLSLLAMIVKNNNIVNLDAIDYVVRMIINFLLRHPCP